MNDKTLFKGDKKVAIVIAVIVTAIAGLIWYLLSNEKFTAVEAFLLVGICGGVCGAAFALINDQIFKISSNKGATFQVISNTLLWIIILAVFIIINKNSDGNFIYKLPFVYISSVALWGGSSSYFYRWINDRRDSRD